MENITTIFKEKFGERSGLTGYQIKIERELTPQEEMEIVRNALDKVKEDGVFEAIPEEYPVKITFREDGSHSVEYFYWTKDAIEHFEKKEHVSEHVAGKSIVFTKKELSKKRGLNNENSENC